MSSLIERIRKYDELERQYEFILYENSRKENNYRELKKNVKAINDKLNDLFDTLMEVNSKLDAYNCTNRSNSNENVELDKTIKEGVKVENLANKRGRPRIIDKED